MFCESYRKALSEAAATGGPLPRALETHLAECGGCASDFAAEQRLFASIDSAMSAAVNVEVPASLLPRVREQVASVPERAAWLGFVPVFATALALVCAFAVSVAHRRHPVPDASSSGSVTVAPAVSSAAEHAASSSLVVAGPPALQPAPRKGTAVVRQASVHSDLEVLVSSDEQLGFERYAARLRARAPEFSARAVVISDAAFKILPLEIAEISVGQLAIEPLESGESN
jgi:hypothetical protein